MLILDQIRKEKGKIRAAAYARYSSDMQREESIEAQIRAISNYCANNEIEIVDYYIDRAKTATNTSRPAFQKMISDAMSNTFDIVVVHKLDRFARNRYDSIVFRAQLKNFGVVMLSVIENLDGSPESLILESVLEGMNEYYSRNLAREIEKGKTENAYQARHNGGIPPLGYDVDKDMHLVINDKEATCVRFIFNAIADGSTNRKVFEHCKEYGWKTKVGNDFTSSSLFSILRNEKYVGVYVYNRSAPKNASGSRNGHKYKASSDIIRVEGVIPSIVDKELFSRVQQQLSKRKKRSGSSTAKREYLLTGKLRCGYCDAPLVGNTRNPIKRKKSYSSYRCSSRRHGLKCELHEVESSGIEGVVLTNLSISLFNPEIQTDILREYRKHASKLFDHDRAEKASEKRAVAKLNRQINNLVQALAEAHESSSSVVKRINELERNKSEIENKINESSYSEDEHLSEAKIIESIDLAKAQIKDGSISCIKRLIEDMISRIVVTNDRIDIFLVFLSNLNYIDSLYFRSSRISQLQRHKRLGVNGVAPSPPRQEGTLYGCLFCRDWL